MAYAERPCQERRQPAGADQPGPRGRRPPRFQLDTYPAWARPNIHLLPEGVNLETCRPLQADRAAVDFRQGGSRSAADDLLVTYVARDLEPYRGFHQVMRALPRCCARRPDARVVLVGGDGVSYGAGWRTAAPGASTCWRSWGTLDTSRVHFPGKLDYASYIRLLQRSDAHVYFTYPVRRLLVAAGGDGLRLRHGGQRHGAGARVHQPRARPGVLTPFFDPGALADRIGEGAGGAAPPINARCAPAARAWAETHLSDGGLPGESVTRH